MRQALLEKLALQLGAADPDLLGRTRIILPNRRSGLFLQRHMAIHSKQSKWAPLFFSMSDFIQESNVMEQGEPVDLLFTLYDVYRDLTERPESLDEFYHRGETMIRDFDELDKYLVDAESLFANIMDLKALEEPLAGLEAEQIAFVRQFWSGFHSGELTPEKEEFLNTWKLLPRIYKGFREQLRARGQAYQGMLYREIAERIARGEMKDPWEGRTIVAGFNALNRCEKAIFSWLKIGGAEFYWDYDRSYIDDQHSEAGSFLRDNLERYPPAAVLEDFNGLDKEKDIRIFELPTDVLQAKTLGKILEESESKDLSDCTDTAVILCDEELLMPALLSLPESTEDINVTMGYPLKNTPVFGFTEALMRLHHHARRGPGDQTSFYHRDVLSVLLHPYYRTLSGESSLELSQTILAGNLIMVESSLFHAELDQLIFRQVDDAPGLVDYLRAVFQYILERFELSSGKQALDREYLFRVLTHLNLMESHLASRPSLSLPLIESLLRKSLSGLRIPFEGEPLSGLQVMGILETRLLDFRHVILLSMNEDTMPAPQGAPSHIPYSLRLAFQMPGREERDAIYAYYFYRLLQRAEKVDLMYNSGSEGVKSGEMSRYLYQLMFDRKLEVIRPGLDVLTREVPPIVVEHSPAIAEKLEVYLQDHADGKYLSPSAINTYIDCSLRFYLRYLAGIGEAKEVEEEIGAAGFGTVVHDSMQILYSEIAQANQQKITPGALEELSRSGKAEQVLREVFLEHHFRGRKNGRIEGRNIILFQVMLRYLKKIIQTDRALAPFILDSVERTYERELQIETAGGKTTLRLGGKIDRVDQVGEVLRVIDYKTGGARQDFASLDSLFDGGQRNRNGAAMQTLYYAWLVKAEHSGERILPGLYVMKALFQEDFDPALINKDPLRKGRVEDFSDLETEYMEGLTRVLQNLYDPSIPYVQRENDQQCSYCDFAELCSRKSIE